MARPLLSLLSLLVLAAGIVLQFFLILSGGINSAPQNRVYFLEADVGSMRSSRNPARWTYWAICGADANGLNTDCGSPVPALPFSPSHRSNFDSDSGVPEELEARRYYLLSRFAWVFFLMALLFSIFAFITGGLALCTRIGAIFSSLTTSFAFFWQILASALMTAWTVQARDVFRANNLEAHLGKWGFGFAWGATAALLVATILFCASGTGRKERTVSTRSSRGGFFRRRHHKEVV